MTIAAQESPLPVDRRALLEAGREARALIDDGDPDGALLACEQMLQLDPECGEGQLLLGLISYELEEPAQAVDLLERLHNSHPNVREYAEALAAVNARVGRINEGLFYAKLATALPSQPEIRALLPEGYGDFLENLAEARPNRQRARASALLSRGDAEKAITACEKQLELTPGDTPTLRTLARACRATGRMERAIAAGHAILHSEDWTPEDQSELAGALADSGRFEEAMACHRAAAAASPHRSVLESRALWDLVRQPGADAKVVAAAHAEWAARHAAPVAPRAITMPNRADPERRLKIAYLLGEVRETDLTWLLAPVLEHHDPKQVEVFCYADGKLKDAMTERLITATDKWTEFGDVDDETACEILRGEGIDLVVDLAGHGPGGRPLTVARRPAPIAVGWLGYPCPRGAGADYYLASTEAWPEAWLDAPTGERIWRLEGCLAPFQPPGLLPEVGELPAGQAGHVTLGAWADLARLGADTALLWAPSLRRLPGARLLIANARGLDDRAIQQAYEAFSHFGLRDQVDIINIDANLGNPLTFYRHVDIALATPYMANPTALCRGLWMGVPTLALAGDCFARRLDASLLRAAGLGDWVAADATALADRVVALAHDRQALAQTRQQLRARVAPTLGRTGDFTRRLEGAYRGMWRRWCDARTELGAQSAEVAGTRSRLPSKYASMSS